MKAEHSRLIPRKPTENLEQWFLTVFTYHTLLSSKVTRFTSNTLNGAYLLKYEINKFLQFRIIYKNIHCLQYMVQ